MNKKIILTEDQIEKLNNLWFIYGNNGKKFSMKDHKFIQGFIEHKEDLRNFYKPSLECMAEVDKILMQ
jgi:hypothetical protein